ncbi:TRAP transporter substrate-binding protein [Brachybacterium sp. AOP43-C2-M15]|uniref:TRAP transporter substrate-binding protein n=1 Tax=Brachybacterium sp. AOP43-C2-M15 TaxID=3457661 RepID=UPI0040332539
MTSTPSPTTRRRARPRRRDLLRGIPALGLGAAALAGCSQAGATTDVENVLSVSLNQAEDHPSFLALTYFGEQLAERTEGRWGARIYANEALGAQQEVMQLVSDGSVDLAVISSTQVENLSMAFRPLNLPGAFEDIEHQTAVLNDESLVGELFSSLEAERRLRVLGGFTQGSRHVYTDRGPIEGPEDLAGLKIRVQESDVFMELTRALGGSPTPMAYGEVYTALQAGVLNGAENNEVSYVTQRHYEIAPHFTLTNHLVGLDYVMANVDRIEDMDAQDQDAFAQAFTATQEEFVRLWSQETEASTEQMIDQGVEIHEPDPEAFTPLIEDVGRAFLQSPEDEALYEAVRAVAETRGGEG